MTNKELQEKAKRLLDEHVDKLDSATLSKLHQARSQALEGAGRRQTNYPGWVGAGALAASLSVAFVYFEQQPPPLPSIYEDPIQQAAAADLELMDDLEFIAWLVLEEGDINVVKST